MKGGFPAAPGREAGDVALARHRGPLKRCIVPMRANDNKNASRVKSYGRFLNGLDVLLMNGSWWRRGTMDWTEERGSGSKARDRPFGEHGRSCGRRGGESSARQGQKAKRPNQGPTELL